MGVIDTLKDFAGDVADDSKEAFDELLDRDDDDRDPWDRNPWDNRATRHNARKLPYRKRRDHPHGEWDNYYRGYYWDDDYGYCYCECYCHSEPDSHSPARTVPPARSTNRLTHEPNASANALPPGRKAESSGHNSEPADTAALSTQINQLTDTVNALRASLEQLPRTPETPGNQNGTGAAV